MTRGEFVGLPCAGRRRGAPRWAAGAGQPRELPRAGDGRSDAEGAWCRPPLHAFVLLVYHRTDPARARTQFLSQNMISEKNMYSSSLFFGFIQSIAVQKKRLH